MQTIIGQKVSQTQRFLEDGTRIPVTAVILSGGNTVVQSKTADKDGYNAVQLGFGSRKKASKSLTGHVKGATLEKAPLFLREARVDGEIPTVGTIIKASDVLKPGDVVDVIGISKGKGYAGGVKRYHFKGGPRTHGQSDRERAPGSIGQSTTPGRVYKGKRMAGRMGHERVTVANLMVVDVTDDGVLIKGLVPGPVNNLIMIKKVGEAKKFTPLYKEISDKQEEISERVEEVAEETPEVSTETAGSTPVSDETTQGSAESVSHVSDAAQPSELVQSQESASLSDNQAPVENTEVQAGSAPIVNTSENENASVPSEDSTKEEVTENAK